METPDKYTIFGSQKNLGIQRNEVSSPTSVACVELRPILKHHLSPIIIISLNMLNPSLYDKRVDVRECPYAKVTSPELRLESSAKNSSDNESSSDDESSLSANSPIPQVTIGNKVVSKITPNNDDVRTSTPIKDKMSQSLENQMDIYELCPRNNPNHTECSRAGEMSLLPVVEPVTQELVPPTTQVPAPQVARGSIQSTTFRGHRHRNGGYGFWCALHLDP
ncbi:hypothetical protein LIER_22493 [Lithospermum erythrorhizon]|uniref:Uncharacterized protein n=1 Tax=Lithospermum erythrorhizon TaxID=34254 RepID=A0AAV3QVC8_LITER